MKKRYLLVFLVLLLAVQNIFSNSSSSQEKGVCIFPSDDAVSSFVSTFYGLQIKEPSALLMKASLEELTSADTELMDMFLRSSDAAFLIIPVVTDVSSFIHRKLYIYDQEAKEMTLCHESLSQETGFPVDAALALSPFLSDCQASLIELKNLSDNSRVFVDGDETAVLDSYILLALGSHSLSIEENGKKTKTVSVSVKDSGVYSIDALLDTLEYRNLEIDSSPKADVFADGKRIGSTPLVIETYSLPLLLTLNAEGYRQSNISLSTEQKLVYTQLKPSWMDNSCLYEEGRKDFYSSFARSMLIFAAKVASELFISTGKPIYEVLNMTISGALVVSVADTIRNLIDYYNNAQYVSP